MYCSAECNELKAMSVDEWFRRPKGQCCGPPAEPPLIMSAGRCVRMQMLRLWVEGWAARAQGLQMQLLRSAALHAAAATSPLTRAPTTGLMVDSWCLCCVAEDPRRLHYSNPPECRLLVVYQWLGGHYSGWQLGPHCSVEAWCAADAWAFRWCVVKASQEARIRHV